MTDLVTTTGRPMSKALTYALAALTGLDRDLAIRALSQSDSPRLGGLHRALAVELRLCDLRDENTLRMLSRDALEEIAEPPLPAPPAGGTDWWPDGDAA